MVRDNKISAFIRELKYKPYLCKELKIFPIGLLEGALSSHASFLLQIDPQNTLAVSSWVSPKRTRSYPYARVYDTLAFKGKRVTIIPVYKDEGKNGDRDFLQWDTISLMSLYDIYVIIAYYNKAELNGKYNDKITNQRFEVPYILSEIERLKSYNSSALHWNMSQIDGIYRISTLAQSSYKSISTNLNVKMHSEELATKKIDSLYKEKEVFMNTSRIVAEQAQYRESKTVQPKEFISGIKGQITIQNYLGGKYFFTCDEVEIHKNKIFLIEAKHSKNSSLPSRADIQDGLLKLALFSNLVDVKVNDSFFEPIPTLKLTTESKQKLSTTNEKMMNLLIEDVKYNKIRLVLNDRVLLEHPSINKEKNYD